MLDSEPTYPHEPDHIIAVRHSGSTTATNLAYACFECDRAKGTDISSLDPEMGALTPLYNSRTRCGSSTSASMAPWSNRSRQRDVSLCSSYEWTPPRVLLAERAWCVRAVYPFH